MAYNELEPIGIERIEYCIANLCSNIVNIVRHVLIMFGGKGIKMTSPMNFMPIWDVEEVRRMHMPKKQSIEEMKQILKGIAAATGKKLKRYKDRK